MPQIIKRKFLKYLRIAYPVVFIGAGLIFLGIVFYKVSPYIRFCRENNLTSSFFYNLLIKSEPDLITYQDRANIVFLGIGNKDHSGQDLTDSIILLSVDNKKKDALMVSIPRDIYLPSLKDRINTAYHYGEERSAGGGLLLVKSSIEEIIGTPVHYAMLINFSGFKKLIDLIGGVDIEVKQEFTDDRYPIEGKENDFCQGDINFSCRYEIVYFAQGWQHMDGEKALKYARSRYSESNEGNDFARSKRQQQLIIAVKEKLMATKFWFKPDLVKDLSGTYQQIVTTDMNWSEQISIGKILLDMQNNKIRHLSLDTGDDKNKTQGLLVNPPVWQYNGAWVLVPRAGDFSEIKKHITCYIDDPNCQLKP